MRQLRFALLGPIAFFLLLLVPAGVTAQSRGTSRVDHTLTVVVPSVVRLLVDRDPTGMTGFPVIRVITNDRVVRARAAGGLPAELVQRPPRNSDTRIEHVKGGEDDPGADDDAPLVRYTVVTP